MRNRSINKTRIFILTNVPVVQQCSGWCLSRGVSDTLIVYTLILSDQVMITVRQEVLVIMAIILMKLPD